MTSVLALLIALTVILLAMMRLSKQLRKHLSARIAVLILVTAPIILIAFLLFNAFLYGTLGEPAPKWSRALQLVVLAFGTPLVLGLLASRYVTKPLKQFTAAIASLKNNNRVQLKDSGIREFDEVFAEFNDLTKRLQHEEELRKNLISDASHELNTPVTAMLSQLTAMREGVLPITKSRVHKVERQAGRLTGLIALLNEYTKARSSPVLESKTDIDFVVFAQNLNEQFAVKLKEQNMELVIELDSGYTLSANREACEHIFTNLMENALRYSGAKHVTIHADDNEIIFCDDGQGVPDESLRYLFERFYRVDTSRSRNSGGLGLGLAIVRELAHRQGWRISAQGANPGLKIIIKL